MGIEHYRTWRFYKFFNNGAKALNSGEAGLTGLFASLSVAFFIVLGSSYFLSLFYYLLLSRYQ